ncbi:hypothetical protein [Lichenibacterium dinghuense]|uniref:hypothetical protein n=1 Tax=Lichenibacterium dinghuense TaxID=2895977 RepID=UPI001F2CBA29|nr:hypothetical protein [Lichenibacterium sp. 6Y81]
MPSRFRARSVLAALALLSIPSAGRAEPAAADQEACTPDVFKICSSAIPSETAIVACLNAHIPQLSPACRAVIDPPKAKARRRHRA